MATQRYADTLRVMTMDEVEKFEKELQKEGKKLPFDKTKHQAIIDLNIRLNKG